VQTVVYSSMQISLIEQLFFAKQQIWQKRVKKMQINAKMDSLSLENCSNRKST
jgi:hypothetical protein